MHKSELTVQHANCLNKPQESAANAIEEFKHAAGGICGGQAVHCLIAVAGLLTFMPSTRWWA
jgi:hypothetical protein